MKNRIKFLTRLLPVALLAWAVTSCDAPDSASLFDENYVSLTPPEISSVSPEDWTFAGYEEVVINGSNFSSDPSNVFVYFNSTRATILQASETQLLVRTPNLVADSVGIKVSVLGVDKFSNSHQYRLEALFEDIVTFPDNEEPWIASRGTDGSIYASYEASGSAAGIKKFGPDGEVENPTYAPAQNWFYRSAAVDDEGNLYLVRGGAVPFIYRVLPGGSAATSWRTGLGRTEDVIFGGGYIWSGGTNEGNATNARINRTEKDATLERFEFDAQIYALAYANSTIYVAGTRDGDSYIWRLPLDANDEPGAEEVVANLTSAEADGRPTGLVVAADGVAIVSMSEGNQLYEVTPAGQVTELYNGILPGNPLKMEFIPDSQLVLITLLPFNTDLNNRIIQLNVQRDAP
ncbi:MAG: IPT/TIG domain-containing protein [Balneolales bacterium]|nr:IPT/TIG domain-containing protein [Balneolales bacterium]